MAAETAAETTSSIVLSFLTALNCVYIVVLFKVRIWLISFLFIVENTVTSVLSFCLLLSTASLELLLLWSEKQPDFVYTELDELFWSDYLSIRCPKIGNDYQSLIYTPITSSKIETNIQFTTLPEKTTTTFKSSSSNWWKESSPTADSSLDIKDSIEILSSNTRAPKPTRNSLHSKIKLIQDIKQHKSNNFQPNLTKEDLSNISIINT